MVETFAQPILIIRWATTSVGCILATPDILDGSVRAVVAVAVLLTYSLFRTSQSIRPEPGLARLVELVTEAGGMALLVAATGYLDSAIAFSLLTAVACAGFLSGFGLSIRLAVATSIAIGIPHVVEGTDFEGDLRLAAQWTVELFLVAVVAAYARRISGEAAERDRRVLTELSQLADANDLLFSLHQAAQVLPSSLDLDDVLDSTMERLRDAITLDVAAILLLDETDGSWQVVRRYGTNMPPAFDESELPEPLRVAVGHPRTLERADFQRTWNSGLAPSSSSGMYRALRARGDLVGLLAVERTRAEPFSDRERELLDGLADPAALAIDNARWFGRLRTVGADEERTRIARDLHDRIGQSLAYLAFELDRIVKKDGRGDAVTQDLGSLREDVRGVVREVRDTLYDLRTDVSEERPMADVLAEFTQRVQERSEMGIDLRTDVTHRIPVQQERELWRIAQEAIVNAERHSGGDRIEVFWFSNGEETILEIRDNGAGLPLGSRGRIDSYGMLGMRERADSIGARLFIDSRPQRGVTVRVVLRSDDR